MCFWNLLCVFELYFMELNFYVWNWDLLCAKKRHPFHKVSEIKYLIFEIELRGVETFSPTPIKSIVCSQTYKPCLITRLSRIITQSVGDRENHLWNAVFPRPHPILLLHHHQIDTPQSLGRICLPAPVHVMRLTRVLFWPMTNFFMSSFKKVCTCWIIE